MAMAVGPMHQDTTQETGAAGAGDAKPGPPRSEGVAPLRGKAPQATQGGLSFCSAHMLA